MGLKPFNHEDFSKRLKILHPLPDENLSLCGLSISVQRRGREHIGMQDTFADREFILIAGKYNEETVL